MNNVNNVGFVDRPSGYNVVLLFEKSYSIRQGSVREEVDALKDVVAQSVTKLIESMSMYQGKVNLAVVGFGSHIEFEQAIDLSSGKIDIERMQKSVVHQIEDGYGFFKLGNYVNGANYEASYNTASSWLGSRARIPAYEDYKNITVMVVDGGPTQFIYNKKIAGSGTQVTEVAFNETIEAFQKLSSVSEVELVGVGDVDSYMLSFFDNTGGGAKLPKPFAGDLLENQYLARFQGGYETLSHHWTYENPGSGSLRFVVSGGSRQFLRLRDFTADGLPARIFSKEFFIKGYDDPDVMSSLMFEYGAGASTYDGDGFSWSVQRLEGDHWETLKVVRELPQQRWTTVDTGFYQEGTYRLAIEVENGDSGNSYFDIDNIRIEKRLLKHSASDFLEVVEGELSVIDGADLHSLSSSGGWYTRLGNFDVGNAWHVGAWTNVHNDGSFNLIASGQHRFMRMYDWTDNGVAAVVRSPVFKVTWDVEENVLPILKFQYGTSIFDHPGDRAFWFVEKMVEGGWEVIRSGDLAVNWRWTEVDAGYYGDGDYRLALGLENGGGKTSIMGVDNIQLVNYKFRDDFAPAGEIEQADTSEQVIERLAQGALGELLAGDSGGKEAGSGDALRSGFMLESAVDDLEQISQGEQESKSVTQARVVGEDTSDAAISLRHEELLEVAEDSIVFTDEKGEQGRSGLVQADSDAREGLGDVVPPLLLPNTALTAMESIVVE